MTDGLNRRQALSGVAAAGLGVGLGLPLLAACGGGDSTASDTSVPPADVDLGAAADIPVGGGTVFGDAKVVVTQPTQGDFRAFSAICTHQHCLVGDVADGTINCPCHLSKFSIEDGSVRSGPAPSPLPEVRIEVDKGEIRTKG